MLARIFNLLAAQFSISDSTALETDLSGPWPNGPFNTFGSWILDVSNNNVTYAGVNWPGAAETMVPEGLQYQSIGKIVAKIKSVGMNSIRLTYATELIDQIYDNNMTDVPISAAFINALGVDNGTRVFNSVVANNPSFGNSTTRLQVRKSLQIEWEEGRGGRWAQSVDLDADHDPGVRCNRRRVCEAENLCPPGQPRIQGLVVLRPLGWEHLVERYLFLSYELDTRSFVHGRSCMFGALSSL